MGVDISDLAVTCHNRDNCKPIKQEKERARESESRHCLISPLLCSLLQPVRRVTLSMCGRAPLLGRSCVRKAASEGTYVERM